MEPRIPPELDRKIAAVVAASAFLVMVVLFALLLQKEQEAKKLFEKDIQDAIKIMGSAPKMGDYEIHLPARSLDGDMVIARINGRAGATFPAMSTGKCILLVGATQPNDFRMIEIETVTRKTAVNPARKGGMEVAAACGQPLGSSEDVRVTLTP